jgi:hypothetical protein
MTISNSDPTPPSPTASRQTLLDELASLTSIERGSLCEEYRMKPSVGAAPSTKLGPYFKLQSWVDNKNLSARIPAIEVPLLRQDLENGQRFSAITATLADMAISESRANRKALSPAAADAEALDLVAKKNSSKNASKKGIAKPKRSSLPSKVKSAKTASPPSSKT